MKHTRRIASLLLALVMVFSLAVTGFAAGEAGTIIVENANDGQVYTFYRLFEAVPGDDNTVSYKPLAGKTIPENNYFKVENGYIVAQNVATGEDGKLSTGAVEWLTTYYDDIGEKITEKTGANADLTVSDLPYGYYYVTTTTGTVISVDTTTGTATITDKNPLTSVDKSIIGMDAETKDKLDNVLAQIGSTVKYESRVPVQNGAYNYVFTDVMTDGLTLNDDSVQVYVVERNATVAADAVAATGYGTQTAENKAGTAADISITFDDEWLKQNWGKDIVIQYSAVVNANAIIADAANPNTAKIEYGNKDKYLFDTDDANVWSAKISVVKTDGEDKPLAGAKFMLKNSEGKYYKLDATTGVQWVDKANADEVAAVAVTTGEGESATTSYVAEFKGLKNGTYTLEETTVPDGYNKAADVEVTIADADFDVDNLAQSETVVNKAGSLLPSTGGMGTTLFYMVGGLMVLAAVVLLVTKKRMASAE